MFLLIFVSCFLHCLDSLKHDIQLLDQRHELEKNLEIPCDQ